MNGHQQTMMNPIAGFIMKKNMPFKFKRELFTFKDQGTIAIDWAEDLPDIIDKRPLFVVLPGLSSNNNDCYVLNLLIDA
jgi:predicted alpha/beta-fold hydrolase